ncbi:MAG: MATE family efflux transporter [Clostridia bacterium]|nr:MATE family efflux transporter [Clostridia bacterium]
MQQNKAVFEDMPVPKALATLAVPTIISQLITMIYNLADTFFIGRTNDPLKVAAATVSFILLFMMSAWANLFGVGGGSLMSRLLGEKRPDEAKNVAAFSFFGAIIIAAVYSIVIYIFMDPILMFIGASENTIVYARDYAFWVVTVGGIPTTMTMTMAHLLRSEGYAKEASFGLGMGGVLNIAFDPLFMFVVFPKGEEVAGAAFATMLSNVIVFVYMFITYLRLSRNTCMSVSPKRAAVALKFAPKVLSVGLPSAINTLLSCISNSTINSLMTSHGDIPMAAMGVVKKIDMLPMNIGMGLCQGMLPLVAYNYAAKNYKRMKAVSNTARLWGICFAGACIILFELFTGNIVKFFIEEAETLALGTSFLKIACLATPLMVTNVQMNYTFQAMGKGKQSLILSSCRQGLVNIPLLFIMNHFFGMYGIVWTQFIADLITLAISFTLYFSLYKKLKTMEMVNRGEES